MKAIQILRELVVGIWPCTSLWDIPLSFVFQFFHLLLLPQIYWWQVILNDVVLPVIFLPLTDTPAIDVILVLDVHPSIILEVPLLKRLHFLSKALIVVKL